MLVRGMNATEDEELEDDAPGLMVGSSSRGTTVMIMSKVYNISSAWFQNIVSAYFIDFHFFIHSDRSQSALSNGEVFKFPLLTVKKLLNFENNRI